MTEGCSRECSERCEANCIQAGNWWHLTPVRCRAQPLPNWIYQNPKQNHINEWFLLVPKHLYLVWVQSLCTQEHQLLLQGSLHCSSSKKVSCVQRTLGHGFSHFPLSPVFVTSDTDRNSWRTIFTQNSVISPEVFLLRNFLVGHIERSLRTGGWRIKTPD